MASVADNLIMLAESFRELELRYQRSAGSARLLAVGKRHDVAALRAAYAAGQRDFGENYLQEALDKQLALAGLDIVWHYIGAIQSNKTGAIAANFDWVHTVERQRVADRLNHQRSAKQAPLNVLIQVNISGEASKHGVDPDDLAALAQHVHGLPQLRLRGLMALPAPESSVERQRAAFARVSELAHEHIPGFDTLSMGTSADYPAAIAEGATLIRLGTALFGPRPD